MTSSQPERHWTIWRYVIKTGADSSAAGEWNVGEPPQRQEDYLFPAASSVESRELVELSALKAWLDERQKNIDQVNSGTDAARAASYVISDLRDEFLAALADEPNREESPK